MNTEERLLRIKQVSALTGLPKPSIYARMAEGSFPRPISLGARAVAWLETEVRAWIAARIAESRGGVPA